MLTIAHLCRNTLHGSIGRPTVGTHPAEVEEDCEHARLEYSRALGPPTVDEFRAASLHEICTYVGRDERETTLEMLTAYLLDMFPLPTESEHKNQQRRLAGTTTLSRRKQHRVDYGRARKLWCRNPRGYYDQLMEGTGVTSSLLKEIGGNGSLMGSLND